MNLLRRSRAWVESVSVVSLLLLVLACTGSKKTGGENPAEHALPADGSSLVLNDFHTFLKDYTPGDLHKSKRNASSCRQCVEVEIQSIGLTTDIDEKKGPAKARVVARMQNNDKNNIAVTYAIRPKDKAEYYIWVDSDPPTAQARWTVVELEKQNGGNATVRHLDSGLFYRCDYDGSTKISEADFKSCARAHPAPSTINRSAMIPTAWVGLLKLSLHKLFQVEDSSMLTEDPAWIRCANGCCTAASGT